MYIGTQPYSGIRARHTYTATAGQTSFSGAGAENVTLTYSDELYIDVYQNGVKLSPADYTATSGTTVVLATGATVSDIVEVIKYDAFSVADTVSAKDGGGFGGNISTSGTLAVTGASTLTGGIANGVTINGTTPTLTIGDAGAEDAKIVFDGNAQDYHIGLDDSADTLVIGKGSALGTTTAMSFDANGIITQPLQPAFSVHKNGTDQSNMAIADVAITFSAERFDTNADFDLTNNRFVAPVTGKYFLSFMCRLEAVDTAAGFYLLNIVTSNAVYRYIIDPNFSADLNYFSPHVTVLADMDASDTASVTLVQNAGTQQTDMDGDATQTFFMGHLVA